MFNNKKCAMPCAHRVRKDDIEIIVSPSYRLILLVLCITPPIIRDNLGYFSHGERGWTQAGWWRASLPTSVLLHNITMSCRPSHSVFSFMLLNSTFRNRKAFNYQIFSPLKLSFNLRFRRGFPRLLLISRNKIIS